MVATKPGGSSVLEKREISLPDPGVGEVQLRHTAIGLNFLDVYFRSGAYPWPVDKDLVTGSEAAGVVEKVGPGVAGFAVGDRVAYTIPNGAYATHRNIAQTVLFKLPDSVSDDVAAASVLKGLTAYYLLHESFKVKSGDTVLFHAAAGGVGSIAGQWLKSLGVRTIGTAGGAEKCVLAKSYGYDHVIDYLSEDFVARTKELTSGNGVDAVYDSIGADTYPGSLHCLKKFGTLVCFGQASGPIKNFAISDLAAGSYFVTRPILFHFTQNRDWLEKAAAKLFDAIAGGKIKVPVGQTFSLENVAEAHDKLESRTSTGSTVLIP